jgi:hypothetical protein
MLAAHLARVGSIKNVATTLKPRPVAMLMLRNCRRCATGRPQMPHVDVVKIKYLLSFPTTLQEKRDSRVGAWHFSNFLSSQSLDLPTVRDF